MFVARQWSRFYFMNEFDSNDEQLGYSELKCFIKPTDGLKIQISKYLGVVKY